ncbi:hypothetical protein MTR_7g056140 [Medicago truncatula]|uniref:Uncharacterized protein n=1 Tax=Medicago truncatula TaxID=3880 RepID=A0A072TYP4_MEDTR|nr:hypothetical protein MTR_7g056140 [Medicago truncatula]
MFHISLLKKTIGNYNEEEELPDHLEGDGNDIGHQAPQHIEHKYTHKASSPQLIEQIGSQGIKSSTYRANRLTGHQALNFNEYAWTQQPTT